MYTPVELRNICLAISPGSLHLSLDTVSGRLTWRAIYVVQRTRTKFGERGLRFLHPLLLGTVFPQCCVSLLTRKCSRNCSKLLYLISLLTISMPTTLLNVPY